MKYHVIGVIDASTMLNVEASSPEEAYNKGVKRLPHPSLCWQCDEQIQVGDIIEIRVDDTETGETVYTDKPNANLDKLRKERDALLEKLTAQSKNDIYEAVSYPASDKLTSLMYEILRDVATVELIEEKVRKIEDETTEGNISYTNGWLAKYAKNLASRIRRLT